MRRPLADIEANQFAQSSGGMGKGTSDGRSLSYAARQADVVRLFPSAAERALRVAELAPKPPTATLERLGHNISTAAATPTNQAAQGFRALGVTEQELEHANTDLQYALQLLA